MATLLSRSTWAKFQFFVKNGPFLLQNVFISDFLARIRNQCLKIYPCAKFQLHWTKDKRTPILTWKDTKNGLMTSYLPPSDDVSKIFIAFERFCPRVPSCQVWCLAVIGPQIKEKQRGAQCALNRVKMIFSAAGEGFLSHTPENNVKIT